MELPQRADNVLLQTFRTGHAVRELMENKFDIEYKFAIDGDKLKGKGALDVGGEKREFDIAGKREKKDK